MAFRSGPNTLSRNSRRHPADRGSATPRVAYPPLMTLYQTPVETRLLRLRATFEDGDQLSIVEAQDHLFDLNALVFVSYLGATPVDAHRPSFQPGGRLLRVAKDALEDTRLESLSYNSPLEIAMYISAVAAPVALVGNGIISLFNRVQTARMTKADADVYVVAQGLVLESLERQRAAGVDVDADNVKLFVEGATRAALTVQSLQIEEAS